MRISDWSSDVCSSDLDALCVANPTRNRAVKLTLRGLTRTRGARPRHRRAPLRQGDVDSMTATLGDSLWDLRDKALLLTARDTLARRSEPARVAVPDLDLLRRAGEGRLALRLSTRSPHGRSDWLPPATSRDRRRA